MVHNHTSDFSLTRETGLQIALKPRFGWVCALFVWLCLAFLAGPTLAREDGDAQERVVLAVVEVTQGQDNDQESGPADSENATTITLSFDHKVDVSPVLLPSPPRLAIDLPSTVFAFEEPELDEGGMIKGLRYGAIGPDRSRLIISMNDHFAFDISDFKLASDGTTQDLTLTLKSATQPEFLEALAQQARFAIPAQATEKADRLGQSDDVANGVFTIMLDPGHGGIDAGAEGRKGSLEKDIVLAFSNYLKDALAEKPNLRVFVTRETDVFVRLSERVKMARQVEANLFISLHADSVRENYVRGATVYTLSERASDAIARSVAESENLSDEVAGLPEELPASDVTDILLDLIKRETKAFSSVFSAKLVDQLQRSGITTNNNPQRSAGFRVLTAPDMPSVLLELGYMSNSDDEALLSDDDWLQKKSQSVAEAILTYAAAHGWSGE